MSHNTVGMSRKVDPLDGTWLDHWTVMVFGPVSVPDIDSVRRQFAQYLTDHPADVLASTLDRWQMRWRQVPAAERDTHVEDLFVSGEPIDWDSVTDYIDTYHPAAHHSSPFRIVFGPDSMTAYFSHPVGDAMLFSTFCAMVLSGDLSALPASEPRLRRRDLYRPAARSAARHWREWAGRGKPAVNAEATTVPAAAAVDADIRVHTPQSGSGWTSYAVSLNPAEAAEFTAWRKAALPGVKVTSLITAAVYRAFIRHGVPVESDGFHTLIDIRRYLQGYDLPAVGNFAKSLRIVADMSDVTSVAEGIGAATADERAIPALIAGSFASHTRSTESGAPGAAPRRISLTVNSMAAMEALQNLPWSVATERRFHASSYPMDRSSLSVFAVMLNGGIEFSVSYNAEIPEAGAVRAALDDLRDIPGLFTAEVAAVSE